MPKGEPYIPETITVHLGRPDADAMNVEVPFADYIKNVASSEIYPTWPEAALRANIYAIITFALNRIYTEWYRSRGYPFDITDSTQYDQKYTYGREVFENINRLVDEQLNTYIRRQGTIEHCLQRSATERRSLVRGCRSGERLDWQSRGILPMIF